jgi:hypothetical protein
MSTVDIIFVPWKFPYSFHCRTNIMSTADMILVKVHRQNSPSMPRFMGQSRELGLKSRPNWDLTKR